LLLVPASLVIVGLLVEEASKVGRPFARESSFRRILISMITTDRCTQHLPFVGQERREIPLTAEAALARAEVRRGAWTIFVTI
jgi:hypothetical protein